MNLYEDQSVMLFRSSIHGTHKGLAFQCYCLYFSSGFYVIKLNYHSTIHILRLSLVPTYGASQVRLKLASFQHTKLIPKQSVSQMSAIKIKSSSLLSSANTAAKTSSPNAKLLLHRTDCKVSHQVCWRLTSSLLDPISLVYKPIKKGTRIQVALSEAAYLSQTKLGAHARHIL